MKPFVLSLFVSQAGRQAGRQAGSINHIFLGQPTRRLFLLHIRRRNRVAYIQLILYIHFFFFFSAAAAAAWSSRPKKTTGNHHEGPLPSSSGCSSSRAHDGTWVGIGSNRIGSVADLHLKGAPHVISFEGHCWPSRAAVGRSSPSRGCEDRPPWWRWWWSRARGRLPDSCERDP